MMKQIPLKSFGTKKGRFNLNGLGVNIVALFHFVDTPEDYGPHGLPWPSLLNDSSRSHFLLRSRYVTFS